MQNFKGSINLLSLVGSKLASMEIEGKQRNVVVVPVDWNDIFVSASQDGSKPTGAYLNLRAWPVGNKYRQTCMERNAGKENYTAPTHQLQVSYGKSLQTAAERAVTKKLKNDPDFMKTNPSEEDISREARNRVNNRSRIGTLTPLDMKPIEFSATAPSSSFGEYAANPQQGPVSPDDDLPF